MAKLTVIEGAGRTNQHESSSNAVSPDSLEALTLLKDFLRISDPAIQQAVADLVAALARLPV